MIKNNLSKLMGEKRIKISELAKLTGIHRNTLTNLYHNKTANINFAILNKLCYALDCTSHDIFEYIPD